MKIAICMPVHGDTKAKFTLSLGSLIIRTMQEGVEQDGKRVVPEIILRMATSSDLAWNRNMLARMAVDEGSDYLLWLDIDHTFPSDTLLRLLRHKVSLVSVNCLTRGVPLLPTAKKKDAQGSLERVWSTSDKAKSGQLELVGRVGVAICLMESRMLAKLEWPLFDFAIRGDWNEGGGEDYDFFRKLEEAGVPTYIDHAVSMDVGHICESVLTFPR